MINSINVYVITEYHLIITISQVSLEVKLFAIKPFFP